MIKVRFRPAAAGLRPDTGLPSRSWRAFAFAKFKKCPPSPRLRPDSLRYRLTAPAKTGGKGITLPLVHPIMLPVLLGLQIFFAERAARCRLQILFKGFCLLRIREGNIGFERPRSPLSSVGNGAAIVISNPLTEVP